jgi:hypothetical protein
MRPFLYASFAICLGLLNIPTAPAQIGPPPPLPNMCPGGLQPDGFIDWSSLPQAPVISYGHPSAPVTATLPITGVPGLTATVTIPALTVQPEQGAGTMPAYTVLGDSLRLNALDANGFTTIILNFNKPVRGLGAVASGLGENGFTATVNGSVVEAGENTNATTAFSGKPAISFGPAEAPVQVRASFPSINSSSLNFSATVGEHGFLQATWANVRIESGTAADPASAVPMNGLELWLRGDKGSNFDTSWQDLSPIAENAVATSPATAPTAGVYDGPACTPVYAFNGNQFLNFNRVINGWNQMTILLVAKSDQQPPALYTSQNSAIFWQESASWGNTYLSPYAGYATYRFGTTQSNNDQVYPRPVTIGGDYSITMAIHNGSADSLYVNGVKVKESNGKLSVLAGTTGSAVLGQGLNGTPFNGKIAEVLVWNRALNTTEMNAVNHYLMQKYGVQ